MSSTYIKQDHERNKHSVVKENYMYEDCTIKTFTNGRSNNLPSNIRNNTNSRYGFNERKRQFSTRGVIYIMVFVQNVITDTNALRLR